MEEMEENGTIVLLSEDSVLVMLGKFTSKGKLSKLSTIRGELDVELAAETVPGRGTARLKLGDLSALLGNLRAGTIGSHTTVELHGSLLLLLLLPPDLFLGRIVE